MKLSAAKVADNRERVIAAAMKLFREKGFDRVSVADLMRDAGLTHGGFYNHFDSKTDLETEVCARAFSDSREAIRQARAPEQEPGREPGLRGYVKRYLSATRRDATAAHCPMVAFSTDAARDGEAIAASYAQGLRAYLEEFALLEGADRRLDRDETVLIASSLIGALSLARSVRVSDPALSDEILDRAKRALLARLSEAGKQRA